MLPADVIAEITTNLAALPLESNLAAQILAAVFAPLLRTSSPAESTEPLQDPGPSERRRRRSGRQTRGGRKPKRKYQRHAPTEARDRARTTIAENPDANTSALAKIAGVSRTTIVHVRNELEREARRKARRKPGPKSKPAVRETAPKDERRERAQRFLRDALASGPMRVSDVEEAAARAHVEHHTLDQARAELGIITSRADSGAHAVQWSLPG